MRYIGLGRGFSLLLLMAVSGHAPAAADGAARPIEAPSAQPCPSLAGFEMAGVSVGDVRLATEEERTSLGGEDGMLPAHCIVRAEADRRIGADGKHYAIGIEMRLPLDWNGRLLFQGGGYLNGVVRPAIGKVKGRPALAKGFAVLTQDAGHSGGDASFGADQQARIDMISRSYFRVTGIGKEMVAAFYGRDADRTYYMGCSEGGREALLAAQRMPLEYDGVVAGNPGFLLGASLKPMVDRMSFANASPRGEDGRPDLRAGFPDAVLKRAGDAILEKCDSLDGLRDGLIENYPACRIRFDELTCEADDQAGCLSDMQASVFQQVFDGRPARPGLPAVAGYPYDSGLASPQWRRRTTTDPRGGGGVGAMQGFLLTPYDPTYDVFAFDAERDWPRLVETGSLNRTDAISYSTLRSRGGKVLIYTGLSDPTFSASELIDYYDRLVATNGGIEEARSFARLFLVPGMTHCSGGRSLDEFDPLDALVAWVEEGKAPEQLVATGAAFPGRSRPVCAYPKQARYKGQGSTEVAANFSCETID